jgi:hypothetical protein
MEKVLRRVFSERGPAKWYAFIVSSRCHERKSEDAESEGKVALLEIDDAGKTPFDLSIYDVENHKIATAAKGITSDSAP